MAKLAIALLFALVGCDTGPVPFECGEDRWLTEIGKVKPKTRYEIVSCPAGMPLSYSGEGCVSCVYQDQCGAEYDIVGCSPAPGVFCSNGMACPAGFDFPPNNTVRRGDQ